MNSTYDLKNILDLMATDYSIPAGPDAYIAICHPRVVYGKNWRQVLRRQRRLSRRRVRHTARVRRREYFRNRIYSTYHPKLWADEMLCYYRMPDSVRYANTSKTN